MAVNIKSYLRNLKFSYSAYNFLHQGQLSHNKQAYKNFGLNKFLFQSISSKDFAHLPIGNIPWLDKENGNSNLEEKIKTLKTSQENKEQIKNWQQDGFVVLKEFFDSKTIDSINSEIDNGLKNKTMEFTLGNKIMFANKNSDYIRQITKHTELTEILSFILGERVIPFQTINFITGSQQRAHSDSIHMTTYPLGYLIAVWIALEDIHEDSGPLFYYPGSHKLAYVLNSDYKRGGNSFTVGDSGNYTNYEDRIEEIVNQNKLEKKVLTIKKGDLLIWHANLIHGGGKINNTSLTRKSMVIHYYGDNVVKYHEITERPALLE